MIAELGAKLADAWQATSWIEFAAALLAILYLLLAIRQWLSCWLAAFLSSALYTWVFFQAHLFMDAALSVFYVAMAVYGFWQWQRGSGGAALPVVRWRAARHAGALAGIVGLSLFTGFFLRRFTPAASPFLDSMVTWSSVYTTFLVARKVYENWHWWLAIDSLSLGLYFTRHLYLTSLLYGFYLVLILIGMREWRRMPAGGYAPA